MITVYKHAYVMEVNSIDQRFSTGMSQHTGMARKFSGAPLEFGGKSEEARKF